MLQSSGVVPDDWALVEEAVSPDAARARQAQAALCQAWWKPVYAFIRRRGHTPEEAEDLTQEFFTRLIETNMLRSARSDRGSFGGFLMGCVRHFLSNEWDRAHAWKRGGAAVVVEIDDPEHDRRGEPVDRTTPDRLYETAYALGLLDRSLVRVRGECRDGNQRRRFDQFEGFLTGGQPGCSYARVAGELGLAETAAKVAVHRLRRRYGAVLREELARTAGPGGDIQGEIRFLIRAVSAA
jgi:RNA polymerase sigma-70 factor (ECF subfamily)